MPNFENAFKRLLGHEGAYGNKAADRGKETVFGISRRFHPDWEGWKVVDALKQKYGVPDHDPLEAQCRAMSQALAADAVFMARVHAFYKTKYWDGFGGDALPYQVAYFLFQFAVNAGTSATAGKLLQQQLNYMNKNGDLFGELTVDAKIGPATLAGLKAALQRPNGQKVLMTLLMSAAVQHYVKIMTSDPSQEEFCYGWVTRAVESAA